MHRKSLLCAAAVAATALGFFQGEALAQQAPSDGRAWEPPEPRAALYGVSAESVVQRVTAADGVQIYVETWLPAAKDGNQPPARVPVVATISPYHREGDVYGAATEAQRQLLAPRGYAISMIHVRGTGGSSGCYEVLDSKEADDAARAIEYLGAAPFSNGAVGLIGISNNGGQQLNVAGRGDRGRLAALKAIVPASPVVTHTDWRLWDGVPVPINELLTWEIDARASYGIIRQRVPSPQEAADRTPCRLPYAINANELSTAPTAWELERELRRFAGDIAVPTLFTMGLYESQTRQLVGEFDRIGARVPGGVKKVALLGQWMHDYPDSNRWVPSWSRKDWSPMLLAWFDRWLLGVHNGVDQWPAVQVQDTTGQWRTEPDFPTTGGPAGQLALSAGGVLGAPAPTGSDVVDPLSSLANNVSEHGALIWQTGAVGAPLRITGVPVLDVWVELERPTGRLAGELLVIGPDGTPMPRTRRLGARSLRHLDPLVENRFAQSEPKAPPVGTPVRVPLRFEVADLVVPKGGRLRLRLAAAGAGENGELWGGPDLAVMPEPDGGPIAVLHDCDHVSALRFLMPRSRPDLLDVRETSENGPLGGRPSAGGDFSGGLAAAPVCGRAPERLDLFGPEIEYPRAPAGQPDKPKAKPKKATKKRKGAARKCKKAAKKRKSAAKQCKGKAKKRKSSRRKRRR